MTFSYFRYQLEGEYDRRGQMTMADVGDPGSLLKQVFCYILNKICIPSKIKAVAKNFKFWLCLN